METVIRREYSRPADYVRRIVLRATEDYEAAERAWRQAVIANEQINK